MPRISKMFEGRHGGVVFGALLAVALLSSGVAHSASSGKCASADVGEVMILPDGSVHQPGRLTLCDSLAYSPVSTLHKTFIDGMPVGMHISHRQKSEGDGDSDPEMMFLRDTDGRLHLLGYALPSGVEKITFLLAQPSRTRRPGRQDIADLPPQVPELLVLVAARTH